MGTKQSNKGKHMKEQKPRTTERDFETVKRKVIARLLALPEGRFPSERINCFEDIIYKIK